MPKLLKPRRTNDQSKPLTIKIPDALSKRLAALAERAKSEGLTLDLDAQLSRALARLLKAAETELVQLHNNDKRGGGDAI